MKRRTIRVFAACLAGICAVSSADAQVTRNFVVEADQCVPPSASTATGRGSATLNAAQTEIEFEILHNIASPDSDTATAAVYNAAWGVNGSSVFTLTRIDGFSFNGTWAVDTNGLAAFASGQLYVQVDTPTYPSGALRGQIDLNPDPQPGDVIVTEIMYDPLSPEGNPPTTFTANPEWIELYNTTFSDIQIGGWFFQDEDSNFHDNDDTGDPCVLERGGTFPDFVLGASELVVVIPDGVEIFGASPSVSDFMQAWFGTNGVAGVNVIQLNADGTAEGALVGDNLSNNPSNDGVPTNDLPLDPADWYPCDSVGLPRADNDLLTLSDGVQVIDVVNFGDDFNGSDWPRYVNGGSITLSPADYLDSPPDGYVASDTSNYTAVANDEGYYWRAHEHSDLLGGGSSRWLPSASTAARTWVHPVTCLASPRGIRCLRPLPSRCYWVRGRRRKSTWRGPTIRDPSLG